MHHYCATDPRFSTSRLDGFNDEGVAVRELLKELGEIALAGAVSSDPRVTANALNILVFGAPAVARRLRGMETRRL